MITGHKGDVNASWGAGLWRCEDGKLPEAVREALHDLGVTWLKEGSALT